MKNKTIKNRQFEFFCLADRTVAGNDEQEQSKGSPERYRAQSFKQKRWFSIHFLKSSS